MEIRTTRFGPLEVEADDVIRFPAGLAGLEGCLDWVFLIVLLLQLATYWYTIHSLLITTESTKCLL